jgi:hypothetical protein
VDGAQHKVDKHPIQGRLSWQFLCSNKEHVSQQRLARKGGALHSGDTSGNIGGAP